MNHIQILSRAWKITWSYRALWIFGIIIALTAGSFSGSSNGGGSRSVPQPTPQPNNENSYQLPTLEGMPEALRQFGQSMNSAIEQLGRWIGQELTPGFEQSLIAIIIGLCCFLLLIAVIVQIGKYVSLTALVRMVDDHETTGEKKTWRQGFRLGWSRLAWRLFLIDLVIGVPVLVLFLVLFGCAILPLGLAFSGQFIFTAAGIVATIGLFFLVILLVIVISVALSLVIETFRRVCILQGLGVRDSIRQGWQLFRSNLKNVAIMWLILVGIQLGISILSIFIGIALLIIGVIVGGGVGVALYFLLKAVATATAGVVAGVVIGLLLFILIVALPFLFLNGVKETFLSTTWTLTYREMVKGGLLQPGAPQPEVLPTVEPSVL